MSEIIKRVIALFLCIAVALGIFTNVYADSNVLRVTAIEISSKSETADVETPSISNNQVQGGVVFNAQNDYAEYLFTIENTDEYSYRIDSIEDNNSVDALSITYSYDEQIAAGAAAHATMRLTYSDLLLNQEAVDISDLHIQIHFTRINEKQDDPEDNPGGDSEQTIDINPNTDDHVTIFVFGSSIALFAAMFALRNVMPRKLRIVGDSAALILAGSAIGIYAVRAATVEEIDINFSNIHLESKYEEYTVYVNTGNGPVAHQVIYGTPLSDILVRPTKAGYHFVKWTDANNTEVSESDIVTGPMSISVNMAPNQYHVIFHGNNDTDATTNQTLTYDAAEALAENSFTYAGYNFDGWATSADGNVAYADKEEVSNLTTGTEDVNLYAKWSKRTDIRYVVRHSYEKLMEDGYTNEDVERQGSIGVDYTPDRQPRTGYVTPDAKTEQIAADGSTVIEYVYNLERKNLGLNDTEFIETETPAGEYKYGYPISLTAKSREGYDFSGWNNGSTIVSTNAAYSFDIKDNVTLTPTYTKKRFDVTINYNNGSAQEVKNVEYGTILSTILTEPSKTGYHFVKWTDGSNHDIDTSSAVVNAMTVNAVYDANKYHVVFNANSDFATGNMSSQEFTYSETKNLTNNAFSWPGYDFAGWATSADGDVVYANGQSVSNLTTGTEDINLYAKWTKITNIHYAVLHRYQKVTGDDYDEVTKDYYDGDVEREISAILEPRTGHETPSQISGHISANGDTVFTYTYPRSVYHLTLHDTDYIETETSEGDYRYGREISLTAKEREGYDFLGWNNGSGIVSEDTTYSFTMTGAVELTPNYAKKKFTVTINPNNGEQAITHNNVEYGTAMSTLLPEQPSKTGYAFVNWTDANSNVITGETIVTSALTVTANYQENTYHVVFNPNGATGEMGSQSFVYGVSQNLTQNAFTWAGYEFDGWATSADGDVVYTNGQSVSNLTTGTEDVNLYAKWHKRTDINYVVTHRFQQAVDGDAFDADLPDDEKQGSVDTEYTVTVRSKTGFQTPSPEPFTINADGSTHIYVDYYREMRTLGLGNTEFIETETPAGDYRYEYPISLTAVARTGYDFLGWHNGTEIVSTNATYSFDLTENVTLEPRYQIQSFTVTVDKSDGSEPAEYTLDYGTSLADYLIGPEIVGYHVDRWTNNGQVVTGETIVEGPMTISAVLAANVYNVVYDANGGTGSMESQEMTYDTMDVLSPNIFVRPGYLFDGWATSADGEVVYTDGQDVCNMTTTTDDVILYAKWHLRTDIPYTVYHRYENVETGFTEVESNELGSIDTDITPPTKPENGFNDPVADSNTPVPGQILLNGTSYFIYNYYRQTRQLTIEDYQYVVTDTYSGTYKYGKTITATATDRISYEFNGWSLDGGETITSTDKEYSFELTDNTTLTPVYTYTPFYYVFKHDGECKIDGGAAVEGDDCGLHPELGYVDTGVKLYDEDNYNLDYEIGFTIKTLDSEQVDQATFVNAKYENSSSSAIGTGLVLRKGGQQPLEVSHAVNGSKQSKQHGAGAGTTVKIVRFNGAIYYSINGGTLTLLQSMRNTNDYKDVVTWFGASYDTATESPWRYLKGTLTNMYIKKGAYDGDTATITLDANGGTVSPTSVRILAGKTLTDSGYSVLPDATGNGSLYFIDWYLDKDTWGQRVTENTVFNSDTTLYARWEATQYACAVFIDNEHTEYRNSLDQCISAVPENTEDPVEVALLLEQNPVLIEIPSTKKVILDGRGLKLTGKTNAPLIRNWGTLYLVDVELVGASSQGTVNNGTDEKKCNTSTCFLYIDGGKITSGSKQALYNRGGNVEIYGGAEIIGKDNSIRATVHNLDSGIITIKDAQIKSQSSNGDANAVLNSDSAGTIIIGTQGDGVKTNTPTITSTYNNAVLTAGQVYFYDGTLTAKKHAIWKTSSPTATNAAAITNSPEAGYSITVTNDGDTNQTTEMYYTASNGS